MLAKFHDNRMIIAWEISEKHATQKCQIYCDFYCIVIWFWWMNLVGLLSYKRNLKHSPTTHTVSLETLILLITTIVIFNLFYLSHKSLLLEIKCVSKR